MSKIDFSFRLELNMDLPSAQGSTIGTASQSSQASQEQVSQNK